MPFDTIPLIDHKYRIVRCIGEGGMGAVYEAVHTLINRRLAIKVLRDDLTRSQEAVARFEREARAASRIGNDHILEVTDSGRLPDGRQYMVMEYLDGETLLTRFERVGRMSPQQIAPIAIQLLEALRAAHRAGIVHRDVKPENIFILWEKSGQSDYVKLIDFGAAKFYEVSGKTTFKTRAGTVIATPLYMSPEQARGDMVDWRSDLYSVGATLYEAVTGRRPFNGGSPFELMHKIACDELPPPNTVAADLDPAFDRLVVKAMARDVNTRFQSAEEFIQATKCWVPANPGEDTGPRSPSPAGWQARSRGPEHEAMLAATLTAPGIEALPVGTEVRPPPTLSPVAATRRDQGPPRARWAIALGGLVLTPLLVAACFVPVWCAVRLVAYWHATPTLQNASSGPATSARTRDQLPRSAATRLEPPPPVAAPTEHASASDDVQVPKNQTTRSEPSTPLAGIPSAAAPKSTVTKSKGASPAASTRDSKTPTGGREWNKEELVDPWSNKPASTPTGQ
jgi:serine/threonine-protein kinase